MAMFATSAFPRPVPRIAALWTGTSGRGTIVDRTATVEHGDGVDDMSYSPVQRESRNESLAAQGTRALGAATLILLVTAGMWVLEGIDYTVNGRLDQYGIHPRDVGDLPDIFSAPFLHVGFGHLMANTVPFLILGFLAAVRGIGRFLAASLVIIVVGGLGVWFTSNALTLGSSILIFGFFGYLIGRGLFERRLTDIVIAVAVVAVYGTMLVGVLPSDPSRDDARRRPAERPVHLLAGPPVRTHRRRPRRLDAPPLLNPGLPRPHPVAPRSRDPVARTRRPAWLRFQPPPLPPRPAAARGQFLGRTTSSVISASRGVSSAARIERAIDSGDANSAGS
ncbi:rhomboid family intramembrane serine protease [Actinomadura logoneensis]